QGRVDLPGYDTRSSRNQTPCGATVSARRDRSPVMSDATQLGSEAAQAPARGSLLFGLGTTAVKLLVAGRQMYSVFARTLSFTIAGKSDPRRALGYMYSMGNQSLVFLCVVMGFIGMIVVYQAGLQLLRVIPDMTQLGATYLELLVKDLAV